MSSNRYRVWQNAFDPKPPKMPVFTFTITPGPFEAHICRHTGVPVFIWQVFADGKVIKGGGGKTEKHATTSAKKDIKLRTEGFNDAIKRWALSPGAFADHPIMVAAEAKRAAAEAIEDTLSETDLKALRLSRQTAQEIYLRETGLFYHKPGTQFVPGMGEGHYD
jgi:hypothetical protein